MIGSSCDSNLWSTRERVWYKLIPQYPCPGGELLHHYHVPEGADVNGVEGETGSGSSSISPPILIVFRSVLCFSATPSQNRQRGVYIVGFRLNQVHGVQDCIETKQEARDGPSFTPHHVPYWHLLIQFLYFPKEWSEKSLGPFDVRKVHESQKHAKTRKSASQC
jgi:hypothetical protein